MSCSFASLTTILDGGRAWRLLALVELAESNLVWVIEADETPESRIRRLEKLAAHFWGLAVEWTKLYGPVCDFQLRGYGEDQGILFEVGKRCHLGSTRGAGTAGGGTDDEPAVADEHERDREFMRRREDRLLGDFDQVHRTYGDLLGRLARERNEAVSTTQETTRITPTLLSSAAGPLAVQFSEIWTSRMSHAVPEFRCAQQAIAYLNLTLTETQLRTLFSATEAIRSFNETLGEASQVADEREAIGLLRGVEKLFRCRAWADVATPEHQTPPGTARLTSICSSEALASSSARLVNFDHWMREFTHCELDLKITSWSVGSAPHDARTEFY